MKTIQQLFDKSVKLRSKIEDIILQSLIKLFDLADGDDIEIDMLDFEVGNQQHKDIIQLRVRVKMTKNKSKSKLQKWMYHNSHKWRQFNVVRIDDNERIAYAFDLDYYI